MQLVRTLSLRRFAKMPSRLVLGSMMLTSGARPRPNLSVCSRELPRPNLRSPAPPDHPRPEVLKFAGRHDLGNQLSPRRDEPLWLRREALFGERGAISGISLIVNPDAAAVSEDANTLQNGFIVATQ
jgi:hypothetical protein